MKKIIPIMSLYDSNTHGLIEELVCDDEYCNDGKCGGCSFCLEQQAIYAGCYVIHSIKTVFIEVEKLIDWVEQGF